MNTLLTKRRALAATGTTTLCSALLWSTAAASPAPFASERRGDALAFVHIDQQEATNACMNHTLDFSHEQELVVRRGSEFVLSVTFATGFDATATLLRIDATHQFDGAMTTIPMLVAGVEPAEGDWGAVLLDAYPVTNGVAVDLRVSVPGDAPVGRYDFVIAAAPIAAPRAEISTVLPHPVVILFNPWSTTDTDVYLANGALRTECIEERKGELYAGGYDTDSSTLSRVHRDWSYDQFDDLTLETMLAQLEGLTAAKRKSAVEVSRRLIDRAAAKQADGTGGILIGNWAGTWDATSAPSRWTRSHTLFQRFKTTGAAVEFGQCWVFSALLNSMSRCVGIPSRPHTTFNAGWDYGRKDAGKIDLVFAKIGGKYLLRPALSDSEWNHHVWCDLWLKHGGANAEWQAADSTYDTLAGFGPMGPAPVAKVKAKTGGAFDTNFFSTAVDGDYQYWLVGGLAAAVTEASYIGWHISTKKNGLPGVFDITNLYKTPEAVPSPPPPGSPGITITLTHPSAVEMGDDISFVMQIVNEGVTSAHLEVSRVVQALAYEGTPIDDPTDPPLAPMFSDLQEVILLPGEATSLIVSIPATQYAAFSGAAESVMMTAFVTDVTTGAIQFMKRARAILKKGVPTIGLAGAGPFEIGDTVECTLTFSNPMGEKIKNARIIFATGEGTTVDGNHESIKVVGDIDGYADATKSSTVKFLRKGEHTVNGVLIADNFSTLVRLVAAQVIEPPAGGCAADLSGDGQVDGADLGVLLANWAVECPCGCAPGDIDGNGVVNGGDLGILLACWGACR